MRIILTGGGTGGHVSPLRAVAKALKHQSRKLEIDYIGQKNDPFVEILSQDSYIDNINLVLAGKWRRYHSMPIWRQVIDIPTHLLNLRDFFYVIIGFWQSWSFLRKNKADLVFVKGGYVGIPVGFAARVLRIPIITHDSDTVPSMTNKIVGKWAVKNLVAFDGKYYSYSPDKVMQVGLPLNEEWQLVDAEQQAKWKRKLHFEPDKPVVAITGSSLGAEVINQAAIAIAPQLIEIANVVHVCGSKNYQATLKALEGVIASEHMNRYKLIPFTDKFHQLTGAADLVISRASATAPAELSAQGRAVVLIPNPRLMGGHQLKNAQYYEQNNAAKVLKEKVISDYPQELIKLIGNLLQNETKLHQLAIKNHKLHKVNKNAAQTIAKIMLDTAR